MKGFSSLTIEQLSDADVMAGWQLTSAEYQVTSAEFDRVDGELRDDQGYLKPMGEEIGRIYMDLLRAEAVLVKFYSQEAIRRGLANH